MFQPNKGPRESLVPVERYRTELGLVHGARLGLVTPRGAHRGFPAWPPVVLPLVCPDCRPVRRPASRRGMGADMARQPDPPSSAIQSPTFPTRLPTPPSHVQEFPNCYMSPNASWPKRLRYVPSRRPTRPRRPRIILRFFARLTPLPIRFETFKSLARRWRVVCASLAYHWLAIA